MANQPSERASRTTSSCRPPVQRGAENPTGGRRVRSGRERGWTWPLHPQVRSSHREGCASISSEVIWALSRLAARGWQVRDGVDPHDLIVTETGHGLVPLWPSDFCRWWTDRPAAPVLAPGQPGSPCRWHEPAVTSRPRRSVVCHALPRVGFRVGLRSRLEGIRLMPAGAGPRSKTACHSRVQCAAQGLWAGRCSTGCPGRARRTGTVTIRQQRRVAPRPTACPGLVRAAPRAVTTADCNSYHAVAACIG